MTLREFIEDLQNELERYPEWADKQLEFDTAFDQQLQYLSIYAIDDETVVIDIGDEGE